MDVIFNSIYARAFMGAGLAVFSGIRAFLPIAFVALYSRLDFHSSPDLENTVFSFLEKTWVVALLFALAVIELVAEKVWVVNKTRDQVMQPIRIALGGLVFAVAMAPDGWIAMVVAAFLGCVIAGLADHVRRSTRPANATDATSARLISAYEDILVLVGTLLFVLVPLIGALVFCFLGLLVYRVQVVRKRKHKGLRILK
ncbi:MAG: DUF4126 domain-containing protein [Thermoleophilia bacterium]|nr:DUF4126 domain-containing protein [Thermoleophilia bacterium]